MKTAAVVCAKGIGDGLLMMIASHRLRHAGYTVVTYHNSLHELAAWFPDHTFKKQNPDIDLKQEFLPYDLVVLQNDNSSMSKELIDLYRRGTLRSLSVFYSSYEKGKHAPLTSWDRVFDQKRSMVSNIAVSISSLLQSYETSTNNGIIPPETLEHRKHLHRVIIHPTSSKQEDMWPKEKFLDLAYTLKERGFEVVFSVAPHEKASWQDVVTAGFALPDFPTLNDLARFMYESGFVIGNDSLCGHLASNMQIPTLIISDCFKRMRMWRPGWLKGVVLTPYRFIPNFKGSRMRLRRWKDFITSRRVLAAFKEIAHRDKVLI